MKSAVKAWNWLNSINKVNLKFKKKKHFLSKYVGRSNRKQIILTLYEFLVKGGSCLWAGIIATNIPRKQGWEMVGEIL